VGERIVFNISQGRKIFKFMKFLEPIRKIHEQQILISKKPTLLRGFSLFTLVSAFFLYLSDNMVWFANMGIIQPRSRFSGIGGKYIPLIEWRRLKDIIALWKNIIELIKYLFDTLRNYKRQYDINRLLEELQDETIHKTHHHGEQSTYELLRELINLRSKLRFTQLGTVQNVLRVVMLSHRLRFAWAWSLVHPITVCVCGILTNIIAIMKLFRDKKQVFHLKKFIKKQVTHHEQIEQQMVRSQGHLEGLGNRTIIKYAADGTFEMVDYPSEHRIIEYIGE
jgi:hypothetical protein